MFGFPKILIELFVTIFFIPIKFSILEPHFSLGLSFSLSSLKFLKKDTPFALAATKKINKNSSIELAFKLLDNLLILNFLIL